jgi:hypothetical protein
MTDDLRLASKKRRLRQDRAFLTVMTLLLSLALAVYAA